MKDALPAPLVTVVVDGRDHKTLPLGLDDLLHWGQLGSEPNAEVVRAVILLMGWAWKGNPASSLKGGPGFHRLANVSAQWWGRHKDAVMKHFVLCSDGRYYHPWLAGFLTRKSDRRPRDLGVSASEWVQLRKEVFTRDNNTCQYCGTNEAPLDCDHVLPLSRGGKSIVENLVAACFSCNREKGDRTPLEWKSA